MLARVYQRVHSAYRGSSECAIRGILSKSYIQITGVDEGLEGCATYLVCITAGHPILL